MVTYTDTHMLFIVVVRNNRIGRALKKPRNSILIGPYFRKGALLWY